MNFNLWWTLTGGTQSQVTTNARREAQNIKRIRGCNVRTSRYDLYLSPCIATNYISCRFFRPIWLYTSSGTLSFIDTYCVSGVSIDEPKSHTTWRNIRTRLDLRLDGIKDCKYKTSSLSREQCSKGNQNVPSVFPWCIIQSICNFSLITMTINHFLLGYCRTKVTDAGVYAARQRFYNNNWVFFNAGETNAWTSICGER